MLASKSILSSSAVDTTADFTQFLIQSGFLLQEQSGVYSFNTLGVLGLQHLETRLRHCLNDAQSVEWMLSNLQSQQNWDKTGRAQDYGDELMSVKLRSGSIMRLSATAEEQITNYVAQHLKGRAVDHCFYQLTNKWRDEIRCRAGLLRSREFRMMDAYYFGQSETLMEENYTHMRDNLCAFLTSLGCTWRLVQSDCGEIGGLMSEELQVHTGLADDGWLEVGHCFSLGQTYSKAFGFKSSQNGFVHMNCFGMGTTRLLAVLLHNRLNNNVLYGDDNFSVFDDVVVALGSTNDKALRVYQHLKSQGRMVVLEDRFNQAGKLLRASELVGARNRWVTSERLGDSVEHTCLKTKDTRVVELGSME